MIYVKWSKLKTMVEDRLHEDVRGKLEFHFARWDKSHDGWGCLLRISFDKETVIEASTDYKQVIYNNKYGGDELIYEKANVFDSIDFVQAMHDILNLSIEEALTHKSPYVRALALVDKRFGKRQLKRYRVGREAYPIVKILYRLRAGKPLLYLNDRDHETFVRRA
jgi:hypothetical protein